MSVALTKQIIYNLQNIQQIIVRYGGIFINANSCATQNMILARIDPLYSNRVVADIQNLGFITGEVRVSGIQTYICIRGFMF